MLKLIALIYLISVPGYALVCWLDARWYERHPEALQSNNPGDDA